MNKQKLVNSLYYRVRIWPVAGRLTRQGQWLPLIDDDWIVTEATSQGIVQISNLRTGHFAVLGSDRIHHFECEPHRDWDGLKHGLFELNTQLVLCGDNNVYYLPRRRRH